VSGERVALLHRSKRPYEHAVVEVLDFNIFPTAPAFPSIENGCITSEVLGLTRIPGGLMFREDVVTSLPYRRLSRQVPITSDSVDGWMIHDDCLVALTVSFTITF
jgi:hypothetical protein